MTTHSSALPQGVRDNFDTGPLSWVMGEIREALTRSKTSVHDAVNQETEARSATLRHAKISLHQAHGALQIVDVDGVAIITETIEDLLDRLDAGQVVLTQDVAQPIENAYQAVIEYLEELLSGAQHQPVRLFPYYRALLEVRGAERIHPADLFFPDLAIRPQLPLAASAATSTDYAPLRKRFEKALLPFLRSADQTTERANAAAMSDIIGEVERVQSNQQSRGFWWIMHGFAEMVSDGQIKNEIYVKQLFARINLQIRRLSEGSTSIGERLLRDALFFIARAENPSARALQIRNAYQLDGLVPQDYEKKRYGQVDAEALAIAKERLGQAKDMWNRLAEGDASVAAAFEQEMNGLADAGTKLNSPSLSKLLRELNGISRHAAHSNPGDSLGLEVASSLLFVENALNHTSRLSDNFAERADAMTSRLLSIVAGDKPAEAAQWLDDMSREAEQRKTMTVLASEMQASLGQVEKMLDEYFGNPSKRTALAPIDSILHQIEGALAILEQDDAMRAIQHTRAEVRDFADAEPDMQRFQHVAQNVGALSFFIETLQLHSEGVKKRFLFDEERGVFHANLTEKKSAIEVSVDAEPHNAAPGETVPNVNEPAHADIIDFAVPASGIADADPPSLPTLDLPTVEDELVYHQHQSAELAISLTAEPDNSSLQAQLKESLARIRSDAALTDNPEANDRAQAAINILERPDFVASEDTMAEIISATAPPTIATIIPTAPVAAPETDEEVDSELLEIFLSEAEEVLDCVRQTAPQLRNEPHNQEYLTTLRRSFHTLKGSGRMVGLMAFGSAAWSIEQVINLKLSEGQGGNPDLYALLDKATEMLGSWVFDLQTHGKSAHTPSALIAAAEGVKNGESFFYEEEPAATIAPLELDAPSSEQEAPQISDDEADIPLILQPAEEIQMSDADFAAFRLEETAFTAEVAPTELDATVISAPDLAESDVALETNRQDLVLAAPVIAFPEVLIPEEKLDDNIKRIGTLEISVPLHNIYLAETDELVRLLSHDLSEWRHEPDRPVNILAVHAAHSLAGSSATVGFNALQEVAHVIEMILQSLARKPVRLSGDEYDTLEQGMDRLKLMLQQFALCEMPEHEPEQVSKLKLLQQEVNIRAGVSATETHSSVPAFSADHAEAEAQPDTIITRVTESPIVDEPVSQQITALVPEPQFEAAALVDEPIVQQVTALVAEPQFKAAALVDEPVVQQIPALVPHQVFEAAMPVEEPLFDLEHETTANQVLLPKDDLDIDLLPIFLEEGSDILPEMGQSLRSWQQNPADGKSSQSLLRLLHTIKGSARMAGAMRLGQHMHEMESRIEQITRSGTPSSDAIGEVLSRFDVGLHLFEQLQNPDAAKAVPVITAINSVETQAPSNVNADVQSIPQEFETLPSLRPLIPARSIPASTPSAQTNAMPAAPVALVRVRADILDRLVNQAGEVSISRSRIETEVDTLRQSLFELTENVSRLRGQLREIEMQAETQMTSQMAHSADREFDPLEFDRFTRLQELTRMMAESVNDVASVQQSLNRTVEGATNDLSTQARLTRDLQQDLMRVRMIQFASISERLYRVTRQVSKEVDKRVNLDIRGSSVEIDRSVLEKMAGPFEHLLRNAIVHGIESRAARLAAGKNETGELLVEIRQEGNEVVIQFSDDGQGLNLNRIRDKAKATGLLTDDADMSDAELKDLIFHPGFSTAQEITELAGRGVGMDVVRSEAAALGGRIAIVSEEGKGAHFMIQLPLTLAVTQAVLLSTGGKTYAVPSVLVEQVQQLKANALATAYNEGAVMWQGKRVPMYYLSALLGDTLAAPLAQQYSPLVILKSGNDRLAIHVDEVIGNREVVVKNIGPQLARMIGIAGATVLGSGDIVLILDPVPLAQRALHESARAPRLTSSDVPADMGAVADMSANGPTAPKAEPVQGLRTQHIVMVVDDSLTVRRVTQRFLVREGYQVVLAKDGVDALEQLQSITPDVMLVDIEMPRMDGFDLTRNVRSDERTRHIPIIMITSRTATKHRNYATELGVNEYLGKPYQEDDLLKFVSRFVNKETPVT